MNAPVAYDSNIKWETTTTYNLGLDYGFLNGRIVGSLDFFKKKTKDLLSTIPIPIGSNFSNTLLTNVGNMEANGIEFAIQTKPIVSDKLNWDVGFNITYNDLKVKNLTDAFDPNYKVAATNITGSTGNSISYHTLNRTPYAFYAFQQVYDESGKPIEGAYVDRDGDGEITSDDRYFYKSPMPKVTLGFSTSVAYGRWTASTVLRANFGNYLYNNVASNFGTINNLFNSGFQQAQYFSDYYISNASFLRMDNLNLAFNVGNIFRNTGNLTLSAGVQNVFVVTKYKGLDPEVFNGVDYSLYPRPRIYSFGLNVGF